MDGVLFFINKEFRDIYFKSAKYRRKMGFYSGGRGNIELEGFFEISGVKMRIIETEASERVVVFTQISLTGG